MRGDCLSNISVIRDLLTRYGFTFSKALGQELPHQSVGLPPYGRTGRRCARHRYDRDRRRYSVVLTAELAKRADKVVCVEIDSRLLPGLDETLGEFDSIRIVNDDVLKVDLHRLIEEEFAGMEVAVCANLPYYITSPILMHLLEAAWPIRSITVMAAAKEAAARLTAEPGAREVGAISIALSRLLHAVGIVPGEPGQLHARPRCGFHGDPAGSAARTGSKGPGRGPLLFQTVKAAFSQRRKTLPNCVSGFFRLPKGEVTALLEAAGIPATARAEQLSMEQFGALCEALYDHGLRGAPGAFSE